MPVFDPGNGNMLVIDGMIVERDMLHIVEKLKDYDEDLDVICLDPDHPDVQITDAPFVVIKRRENGTYERVLEAWQLDDRIIERVYACDGAKHDILAELVKMENDKKKKIKDEWEQKNRDNAEKFAAAMRNKTSSYTIRNSKGELVTINDHGPVTKERGKKSFS